MTSSPPPTYRPYAEDFVCQLAPGEDLEGKGPQDVVRVEMQPRLFHASPPQDMEDLPASRSGLSAASFCPLGCHVTGRCQLGCAQMGACQQCAIASLPPNRDLMRDVSRCQRGEGGAECSSASGLVHRNYWNRDPLPAKLSVEEYAQCRVSYPLNKH